ncbi:MAG: eight-cysteine-cluster domain-containing protein [Myxococcota bacterium]
MISMFYLLWACSAKPSAPEAPAEAPEAPAPAPVPEPVAAPEPAPMSPEALYASCEVRVEQPQSAGECTTDADCQRSGCSSEVCTSAKMAGEVMTTCEIQPCFAVLDACGCHDGQCTWTVAEPNP